LEKEVGCGQGVRNRVFAMKSLGLDCVNVEKPAALIPSAVRLVGLSLLLMIGFSLLGVFVQQALVTGGITGIGFYFDNFSVGILAGLLAFAYERRRSKNIRQKLAMIAAMNQNIHDALQAMGSSPAEQTRQLQVIQRSVNNIESVIKEAGN
jgi:hypothetical protein